MGAALERRADIGRGSAALEIVLQHDRGVRLAHAQGIEGVGQAAAAHEQQAHGVRLGLHDGERRAAPLAPGQ